MKHSPAPWSYGKTVNDFAVYSENQPGNDIALVYQYSRGIDLPEAEANARLIAAAPDLLKALQSIISALPDEDIWIDASQQRQLNSIIDDANLAIQNALPE